MRGIKYNREFKTIDTIEKAYVLGLWYSDGYVSTCGKFSGVTLHKKDKYILEKITDIFQFMYLEIDRTKKDSINLRCNRISFIKDMISLGCLPRKSSTNLKNLRFPKISKKLQSHFIRGFFDGDGSSYFSKTNSINSKYVSFTSPNEVLLLQIKYILYLNNISFRIYQNKLKGEVFIKGRKITPTVPVFTLICSNRKNIDSFGKYIYDKASIFMNRKRTVIEKWYNTLSERSECYYCNSKNTTYITKGYIHCKDCNTSSPLNNSPRIKMTSMQCKHCTSHNTVGNGKTRSKKTNEVISQIFMCKNCKKTSSYKTAPLNGNV